MAIWFVNASCIAGPAPEANSNIRVEVICGPEFATKMTEYLEKVYYEHYAMVAFVSDVQVLRPAKFES